MLLVLILFLMFISSSYCVRYAKSDHHYNSHHSLCINRSEERTLIDLMSNRIWDELEPGSTSPLLNTNMICIYVCLSDRRRDISISVLHFFAFVFLSELMTHFVLVKVKCKLETVRRHNSRRLQERKSQLCPYSGHSGSLTIRVLVFRMVSLISLVIEQGIRGFSRPLKALDKNLAKWLEWWDDGGCTAEEYLLNESH